MLAIKEGRLYADGQKVARYVSISLQNMLFLFDKDEDFLRSFGYRTETRGFHYKEDFDLRVVVLAPLKESDELKEFATIFNASTYPSLSFAKNGVEVEPVSYKEYQGGWAFLDRITLKWLVGPDIPMDLGLFRERYFKKLFRVMKEFKERTLVAYELMPV